MNRFEADMIDEDSDPQVFKLTDGRLTVEVDGHDHRESPRRALNRLTKLLKEGQEIVEICDGSDTIWFGIVPIEK